MYAYINSACNNSENCISNSILCQYDDFHSNAKKKLADEAKTYQPEEEFDPKKSDQYCAMLKEHLRQKIEEERTHLKDNWATLAAGTVMFVCGMNLL